MKKSSLKQLQQQRHIPRMQGPASTYQDLIAASVNAQYRDLRESHGFSALSGGSMQDKLPPLDLPADELERIQRINQNFKVMSNEDLGAGARRAQRLMDDMLETSDVTAAKLMMVSLKTFTTVIARVMTGDPAAARSTIRSGVEGIELLLLKVLNGEIEKARTDADIWIEQCRSDLAEQAVTAVQSAKEEVAAARRQLDEERELLTHAADQSQAEASAARREAEQARRELAEAEARHREKGRKNRDLAAEEVRRAKASEKEARSLAQQQAAQLDAQARELESLRAQLADRDSAVPAQEEHTLPPVPEATTQHQEEEPMPMTQLSTPVEALSYRAWLTLAGHTAAASDKARTVTCETATTATLAAWRAECPTTAEQQPLVFRAFRERRGSVAA